MVTRQVAGPKAPDAAGQPGRSRASEGAHSPSGPAASGSARAGLAWTGPTCFMCDGTGVYPYRCGPLSLTDGGPIRWGRCGACLGNGRDAA